MVLLLSLVIHQMGAAENHREEEARLALRGAEAAVEGKCAARLYCLMKFMRWPGEPLQGPFLIGIAGADMDEGLVREALEGHVLMGRPVQFRYVTRVEEMKRCQMVFVGRTLESRARELLAQLEGTGVLTVASIRGFGQMGGMVELSSGPPRAGKGIVLNAQAARRSGFTFRAELLAVVSIARTQGFAE